MTIEYLEELKKKYSAKQAYFKSIEFEHLAADFEDFLTVIDWLIANLPENSSNNQN